MKIRPQFLTFLSICFFSLTFPGCHIVKPPSLTTVSVTDILPNSAKTGGNITSDGNAEIQVRGVCWSISKNPTTEDPRTTDGYGVGTYTSTITNLIPNTLYYVRAYAINKEGTSYGNQLTFRTSDLSVPALTTVAITAITQTTAISGGNITFDGGTQVTARGVCWSTHAVPTLSDSKTTSGSGTGLFSSNISGLTGNTKYYVRAYATNTTGTGYGQEISFTSGPLLPTVATADPSPTGTTTGTGGGNVTSDGGSAVTGRGVCWSTLANPTITDSRTTNGSGTGTFTSNVTGLAPNILYHVRAYATNIVGTSYGTDKSFITDPVSVTDFDNNDYNVIRIGSQVWTKENLKTTHMSDGTGIPLVTGNSAWAALSTPGYCLYNNDNGNKDTYGVLYNWHAVNSGTLCPTGWHVPTDEEWLTLIVYLGDSSPAGGKMKEAGTAHWASPDAATNESNFTALPGGWRTATGQYELLQYSGFWWSSTQYSASEAFLREIKHDQDKVFRYYVNMISGMSIRCLKN